MKIKELFEVANFPFVGDTELNAGVVDDAMKMFMKSVKVDRNYTIPYVAGYSTDRKTVYIDRDLPTGFRMMNGVWVNTDPFLILHEVVESTLLERFPVYQICHQMALNLERDAVLDNNISWPQYSEFFEKWIKTCGDERIVSAPPDLDLTPYINENDEAEIKKLKAAMMVESENQN